MYIIIYCVWDRWWLCNILSYLLTYIIVSLFEIKELYTTKLLSELYDSMCSNVPNKIKMYTIKIFINLYYHHLTRIKKLTNNIWFSCLLIHKTT